MHCAEVYCCTSDKERMGPTRVQQLFSLLLLLFFKMVLVNQQLSLRRQSAGLSRDQSDRPYTNYKWCNKTADRGLRRKGSEQKGNGKENNSNLACEYTADGRSDRYRASRPATFGHKQVQSQFLNLPNHLQTIHTSICRLVGMHLIYAADRGGTCHRPPSQFLLLQLQSQIIVYS